MKRWAGVFLGMMIIPFVLLAQETENPISTVDEVEAEAALPEETDAASAEETGREIPNRAADIRAAQPGDYILLPSGNRYVLTREEILIVGGTFDYGDLSGVSVETKDDGTEIKTISQAHEVYTYPDGQVVHALKTNAAFSSFLRYIEEKYHLMRYLDSSGVLRESKQLEPPGFTVFRAFIQFEKISNGAEELESLAVSVYNNEGKNFAVKYCSAPNLVWGLVSSEELRRNAVRAIPVIRPISELAVSTAALPSSGLRDC
ncbi:MAG: hypothetical protein LBU82_02030 [Treponema sp.]|jgi:hypothetical protein|nr:hypothetical protein [Treponema sp.]